jgi:glycosyltransferase involved in cell wall biosynthesis
LNKKTILFFGELPPNAIHGIACANQVNLNQLKGYFDIDIVEEKTRLSEHNKFSFRKVGHLIVSQFRIISNSIQRHYDYFYLTLSISRLGSIKTILAIIDFRIFNRGETVLHIHRSDFVQWLKKKPLNSLLARLAIGLSSKIIVLSESQKGEFNSIFDKSCFVLHNTIETEYNNLLAEKISNRFVFISNYLVEKGILDLLEVFSKLVNKYPHITLHTFGAFPGHDVKNRMLQFASPNIVIGDRIDGREKFMEILKADCLVLPSLNEGEPIVLLEAMSVGTLVISTNVGLIPELLGDDYPFVSYPGNKDSLEEKIIQFLESKDLTPVSTKLLNRYRNRYCQRIHLENLLAIFS